jgi:fructose-bisphosphate aldolase, class II
MISLKELLLNYKTAHKALPAFNIDSFEIFQAAEQAVKETSLPCIVQLSGNEDKFIEAEKLFLLVKKAQLNNLPIYLNMDHGQNIDRLSQTASLGFDMVHFDGSSLPYEENLTLATQLKSSHPNTIIEVEFNKIGSAKYTDPSQALEFMAKTNADLLAVSIGNVHGVNLDSPENIDLSLLKNIVYILPDKFFTLHGGSGISSEQIKSAISLGIVKININTDLRLQFLSSLRRELSAGDSEKIYDYLAPAVADVKNVMVAKLKQFSNT